MLDKGQQRTANFFKDTLRDPDARTAPDAAIDAALIVVGSSIDAQARADGRELSDAQRDRALSVAQRVLRALPRDQLQNISAHSGLIKSITDQSLSVAPVTDARAQMQARLDKLAGATSELLQASHARRAFETDRPFSSARFNELASAESSRQMQEARGEAVRLGMSWALENADLLRLGAGAIHALAEVHVSEQSYRRLRREAGFEAKDVVTLAHYAKVKGIKDANKLAGATADVIGLGETPEERERIRKAILGYAAAVNAAAKHPDDPAAQAALQAAAQAQQTALAPVAAKSPHAHRKVQAFQNSANLPKEHRIAEAQTDAKVENAKDKVVQAEDKVVKANAAKIASLGDLDDLPAKPGAPTTQVEERQAPSKLAQSAVKERAGPKPSI